MRTGHTGRPWVIGGVLVLLLMLAVGWLLVVGPQNAETARLDDEAATAQMRAVSLRKTIGELEEQRPDLPRYQEQLKLDRQALPTTAGLSDFLRELQKAGERAGLTGSTLAVGAPTRTTAGGAQVYAFPITLTGTGTTEECDRFLHQLQQKQPRAVLINSVGVAPHDLEQPSGADADLTLGMHVFVAPVAAAGATPSATPAPTPTD